MAKKKKASPSIFKRLFVLVIVLASLTILGWYIVKTIKEKQALAKAENAYYKAFGIDLPQGYIIHGLDVSNYQNIIYWPLVKAMHVDSVAIGFVFIKATEGLSDVDRNFAKNWLATKQVGIPHGAYHFFLATKNGSKQANNFIKQVNLSVGDLPPVVDIEQLYGVSAKNMRTRLKECLTTLEAHYHVKPIIYTYVSFYNSYLGADFNDYPLWVAHYLEPDKPKISRDWLFWQHNEGGHVNGITHSVDFNVFKGDSAAFKKLLIK
ncbi:glycoside hydrolase family 25 protein [Parasediminibacterium paludis]|uniref:Glycoside hydrolase family 25 protein n=1 Tax=Parasediminibacterium paludis TaxID=908966 RepID=A0ABV8PYY8_9BACT